MELEPGAFGRLRFPAIQSDVGECGSAGKLAGEVEVAQVRPRYYGPANSRREIQHAHVQGLRHFSDQSCMDLGSRTTTPGMLHWWPDSASGLPCLGMKKIAKNWLHVVFVELGSALAAGRDRRIRPLSSDVLARRTGLRSGSRRYRRLYSNCIL